MINRRAWAYVFLPVRATSRYSKSSGPSMETTMKRLATSLFALIAVTAFNAATFIQPAAAATPAYYFKFRKTKQPYDSCPETAKITINKFRLGNKNFHEFGAGGSTRNAYAYILCVRLPKDGPCGKDGAMVIFNATSARAADAKRMMDILDKAFGDTALTDCK
jgi:hypothetical protein